MYSESTSLKDHQFHSLKSAEIVTTAELGPASEPQPQRPKISTAEQDQDVVGGSNVYLSPESMGDMHAEQLIHHVSRSLSSSFSERAVSPAAMFLSAFTPPVAFALPDAEGEVVSGYTLGPIIGRGGFSTIRRAFSPTGGIVAVKIVRRSDLFKHGNPSLAHQRLQHEEAIWSSLRHEHILPLFSTVHTSYADFFFTLFCPSGTLFDILGRDGQPSLPQDEAGTMFRQVVKGLRYLHEVAMLVHRDIKLENVLVDDMGVCRIGDFGMSRRIGELDDQDEDLQELSQDAPQFGGIHRAASLAAPPSRQAKCDIPARRHRNSTPILSSSTSTHAHADHIFQPGSLPYASPELLLPQTSGPLLPDPAQDMWALGVLLYVLLTGKLPFTDAFVPRLQKKILQGVYEVPSDIGRRAERVLQGCLDLSVSTRWTIAMVDEVAWGVGWGEDGDDVPPITDEDLGTLRRKSPTQSSASCSQPVDVIVPQTPEWQDGDTTRPSLEAARRRSSSRVERSLLRAPVLASTSRIEGRSISRLSYPPSPSISALNSSILRSTSSSSVSSFSSAFYDSALTTSSSPPSSLDRGRRLKKSPLQSTSRSPSPSVVPTTPVDSVDQFLRPMAVLEDQPNDIERESSRGRKKFSRGVRTSDPELLYSGHTVTELDVLDETAHWVASNFEIDTKSAVSAGRPSFPSRLDSGSREDREVPDAGSVGSREGRRPAVQSETAGGRAGSMPPAPASPWSTAKGTSLRSFADTQHSPMYAVGEFFPTSQAMPMPIPDKKSTRSRSVGSELPRSASLVRRLLKYG